MKTTKQISQEIFDKIKQRETARMQARKKAKRIIAGCLIFGFLTPVAVHFATTEELNHEQPFTIMPNDDLPFDPDFSGKDEQTYGEKEVLFTL